VADAVLIGPGTVRAEGYARLVGSEQRRATRAAAGRVEDPPAVIISRRFDIPWEAGLFAASEQPVIIYTGADAGEPPRVSAPVEVVRLDPCTPTAALADLRSRGVRALLSEGGPTLFRGLLADGLVDELFLTLTPVLTGDDTETPILSGGRLDLPARMALQWVLRSDQELFLRYSILE
jgi:riboflavin biosynthesis pyrimidine reductase